MSTREILSPPIEETRRNIDLNLMILFNSVFNHLDFLSEDQTNRIKPSHQRWLRLLQSSLNQYLVYRECPDIRGKNYSFNLAPKDEINWDQQFPNFKINNELCHRCLVRLSDSEINCSLCYITQQSNIQSPKSTIGRSFENKIELHVDSSGNDSVSYYYHVHGDNPFISKMFNLPSETL